MDDRAATWTCEIGVVPFMMVSEGGDQPLRNAVIECWDKMFPGVPCSISSGWGALTPASPLHSNSSEANLGCATTEELMRELICRFTIHPKAVGQLISVERAIVLAEMLGGLDSMDKHYRTID